MSDKEDIAELKLASVEFRLRLDAIEGVTAAINARLGRGEKLMMDIQVIAQETLAVVRAQSANTRITPRNEVVDIKKY